MHSKFTEPNLADSVQVSNSGLQLTKQQCPVTTSTGQLKQDVQDGLKCHNSQQTMFIYTINYLSKMFIHEIDGDVIHMHLASIANQTIKNRQELAM